MTSSVESCVSLTKRLVFSFILNRLSLIVGKDIFVSSKIIYQNWQQKQQAGAASA